MHSPFYSQPRSTGLSRDFGCNILGSTSRRAFTWSEAVNGTSNLRAYVSKARLPEMKIRSDLGELLLEGHKSHLNKLSVQPEEWRRLRTMNQWALDQIHIAAERFTRQTLPSSDLGVEEPDEGTGEFLSLKCNTFFAVPAVVLPRATDLTRIARWIASYPLGTVQRVMHLIFEDAQEWKFSEPEPDEVDGDLLQVAAWEHVRKNVTIKTSLVVLVQPPWIASQRDLESFARCTKFPIRDQGQDPGILKSEYTSKMRLWGKVYDVCARRDCQWWAVTTYWGWVFGAFSEGMTTAYACPVRSFDAKNPSILEHLYLWVASSMELDGIQLPPGAENIEDIAVKPVCEIPDQMPRRCGPPPPLSDSSWDARSRGPMSVDGSGFDSVMDQDDELEVAKMLAPPLNDEFELVKPRMPNANTLDQVRDNVTTWQTMVSLQGDHAASYHVHTVSFSPFGPPSVVTSKTVSSASSTVRDFGGNLGIQGSWLSRTIPETIPEEYH